MSRHRFIPCFFIALLYLYTGCGSFKLDKPIPPGEHDWLIGSGSPERTHFRQTFLSPPFVPDWNYHTGGGFATNALLTKGNILFVTTLHGELHLIEAETGQRVGRMNLSEPISGSPLFYNHIIMFPLAEGEKTIIAYDLLSGKKIWSNAVGPVESSLLLHNDILYAASRDGVLYAYDPSTGAEHWRRKLGSMVHSSPSATGNMIFIANTDGLVFAIDYKDGDIIWTSDTLRAILTTPVIGNDHIYVSSRDSLLYCLRIADGEVAWSRNMDSRMYSAPSLGSDHLIVGTAGGEVVSLHPLDGSEQWRFGAGSVVNSSPFIAGNFVYFVSLDKHIYILTKQDGVLRWSYEVASRLKTTPLIWKDRLFVCAEDRRVYSFKQEVSEHSLE